MTTRDKKLAELILYISKKSEGDVHFGAIKLNKILFFSDLTAFGYFGKSISGQKYFRLERGPAPKALTHVRQMLEEKNDVAVQKVRRFDHVQSRTIALRDADLTTFSAREIALVDDVIQKLWDSNATETSYISHDFIGWELADHKEEIPLEAIFIASRPLSYSEFRYASTLPN